MRIKINNLLTQSIYSLVFFIAIVFYFASSAMAQQVSISSSVVVDVSIDQAGCVPSATTGCPSTITFHLAWERSNYPTCQDSGVVSPCWDGIAYMTSHEQGAPATQIGTSGVFSGYAFIIVHYEALTASGIQTYINSIYSNNYYAFANFKDANGVVTHIESPQPAPYYQNLSLLGWTQQPVSLDNFLKIQHNARCAGDPVYLHTGQFSYECEDINIPGRKLDVDIRHSYLSGQNFNGPFGYGWFLNYYGRLHRLTNGDVVIVSGNGQKTRYTLSGTSYVSPAGRFETLVKNTNNTFTLTLAHGEKYQFDTDGKLVAMQDRDNNTVTLNYSSTKLPLTGLSSFAQNPSTPIQIGLDYRLTSVVDTNNRTITFNYNSNGLLTSIVDGSRQVSYTYDAANNLLTTTKPASTQFPSGLTKTFAYDSNHNVTSITDPKNQTFVTNTYNSSGQVTQQNLGGGNFVFTYTDATHMSVTDRKTYVTNYTFNSDGNVIAKQVMTAGLRLTDPASFTTNYTYNTDMLMTSQTNPSGNGVKFIYDASNSDARKRGNLLELRRKASMAAADNNTNDLVITTTYDANFNLPKTVTDAKGHVTTFTFDYELPTNDPRYGTKGDIVKIEQPSVNSQIPTTNMTYNVYGQPTQTIDPNGNVTQYTYETATGYLATVTRDPGSSPHVNATTGFAYDAFGNIASVTDANNHTTYFTHNEVNWLIDTTNALGFKTKYTYDANGNITKVERQATSPSGTWQTSQFAYNVLNHMTSMTDPLNRVTTYGYDANENRTTVTDANSKTTTTVYDERDLVFTVTDANSPAGVTRSDYDGNGNLVKIIDANNNATNYTYDGFDRKASMIYADNSSHTYTYDKNSNLTNDLLPNSHNIAYVYDTLDRLTNKNYPQSTSMNATFTYDLGSRLLTANNSASNVTFTYNALNRVASETQAISGVAVPLTVGYAYDAVGNRTTVSYPPGVDFNSTFDAINRRTSVNALGVLNLIGYTYDPLDRVTVKDIYSNIGQHQHYSYALGDQISSVTSDIVGFGAMYNRSYASYDAVGNRLSKQLIYNGTPIWTENYAYTVGGEGSYELTSVTGSATHSFAYDKVNNRTTVDGITYSHNNLNQYTTIGPATLTHDGNGNTTFDGTNTFTYDDENRMVSAVNTNYTSFYAYDALDRRVAKLVNGAPAVYLYSGDQIIEQVDLTGAFQTVFIYGNGIDEPISMYYGNLFAYHQDGLGSIDAVIDWDGNVAEYNLFDVYGQPSILNSPINNLFMFTGRQWDVETETYQYRARQYSPTLGRFLQRDPIGYGDGMNIYAYTKNNPVNYVDPTGRIPLPVVTGLIGAGASAIGNTFSQLINNGGFNNFNFQELGISTGVGFAAGAAAPFVATTTVGTAVLGVGANVINYIGNRIVNKQSITIGGIEISAGAGLIGGLVGGAISRGVGLKFAENSPWLNQSIARFLNNEADVSSNLTFGNLLRNLLGGIIAGFEGSNQSNICPKKE